MQVFATPATARPIQIASGDAMLNGDLSIPDRARGLVVVAHGSGSSRHGTRNRAVALALQHDAFATLLLDLLTEPEDRVDAVTAEFRFDIPLLARRVADAVAWARADSRTAPLPIGLFGASTGAAAALIAAAERPGDVQAIVSRGGRPDLAGFALARVEAPALLVAGELDDIVVDLNRQALTRLSAPAELEVVPGATHLFEEPGALEEVVRLAIAFFERHLIQR
jgi:putative phosphoribosyl transferase